MIDLMNSGGSVKIGAKKPTVAFANEAMAAENILGKIAVLENALKDAQESARLNPSINVLMSSDGKQFEFPTSLRQFNLWDSKRGPNFTGMLVGHVTRHSNETLRRYPEYRRRAEAVITSLRELRLALTRSSKRNTLVLVRNELLASERLRGVLESELLEMKRAFRDLSIEKNALQDELLQLKAIFRQEATKAHLGKSINRASKAKLTRLSK